MCAPLKLRTAHRRAFGRRAAPRVAVLEARLPVTSRCLTHSVLAGALGVCGLLGACSSSDSAGPSAGNGGESGAGAAGKLGRGESHGGAAGAESELGGRFAGPAGGAADPAEDQGDASDRGGASDRGDPNGRGGASARGDAGDSASAGRPGGGGDSGGVGEGGVAGAAGATSTPTPNCDVTADPIGALMLTPIATGLERAVLLTGENGDLARKFVVRQAGTIQLIDGKVLRDTPFLAIEDIVRSYQDDKDETERGLLGLAFHPGYSQNGRFFLYYTTVAGHAGATEDGQIVVSEWRRSKGDADRADPDSERVLFTVAHPRRQHNGGTLAFGPDGFLYVGLGDGGADSDEAGNPISDPDGNAQNLDRLLGKILRIDVDASTPDLPYAIPAGNLTGAGTRPEIWDYGVRNPWRFSFDACSGDLYLGDVGQKASEEVDVEPRASGGRNYGWPLWEGTQCNTSVAENPCDPAGATFPVYEYPHTARRRAVLGGYVYRGSSIPSLRGHYVFADFHSGGVYSFRYVAGGLEDFVDLTPNVNPEGSEDFTSLGQDARGELYILAQGGTVYRIDPG